MRISSPWAIFCLPFISLSCAVPGFPGGDSRCMDEERKLARSFDVMMSADGDRRFGKLLPAFSRELRRVLRFSCAATHEFPLLKKRMNIRRSPDGRLRVFGFDTRTGGTHKQFAVFARVQSTWRTRVRMLRSGYSDLSRGDPHFRDVHYLHISSLRAPGGPVYLFLGWGSHGGGEHFTKLELMRIESGDLRPYPGFVYGGQRRSFIALQTPRNERPYSHFEARRGILVFDETRYEEGRGNYRTGRRIMMRWRKDRFRREPLPTGPVAAAGAEAIIPRSLFAH